MLTHGMMHLFFSKAWCTTFGTSTLKLLHRQWGNQYVPEIFGTLPKCGELVAAMEPSPHDDSTKIHIHLYMFFFFFFLIHTRHNINFTATTLYNAFKKNYMLS